MKFKHVLYDVFNNIVKKNVCNTLVVSILITIETLIYIHTLAIQVSTGLNIHLDSTYDYLKYFNVIFILFIDNILALY